jgi:hypothetical protein
MNMFVFKFSLITSFIVFPLIAHSELTGALRKNYIQTTNNSCFKNQRANTANATTSNKMLKQYCTCSSIHTANNLTNDMVKKIESGTMPVSVLADLANIAGRYCAEHYSEY